MAGRKELKQALGTLPLLQKTTVKLKTFGGRVIEPLGVVQLGVRYGGDIAGGGYIRARSHIDGEELVA